MIMIMQLQHDQGGRMKTGSSLGDHAAAEWSLMRFQHDQVFLIYTRITSHVAMVYVSTLSALLIVQVIIT